jgi:nitrate reductase delta subunit
MEINNVYRSFSKILEYPQDSFFEHFSECLKNLEEKDGKLSNQLTLAFDKMKSLALSRMRENYIQTFDFNPSTSLAVGYHLFGDDYKRSKFMIGLKERYQKYGFKGESNELPDHLPLMINFLAGNKFNDDISAIVDEGIIPALNKILNNFKKLAKKEDEGYLIIFNVLLQLLKKERENYV